MNHPDLRFLAIYSKIIPAKTEVDCLGGHGSLPPRLLSGATPPPQPLDVAKGVGSPSAERLWCALNGAAHGGERA